jgi:hypothetical protein
MKLLNTVNAFGRALSSRSVDETAPLILLGPPRSNSTLIHRLLAQHSEVVSPPLKELLFPGALGGLFRAALSAVPQATFDRLYNPQIHGTGADAPEADDLALVAAFSEGVFAWAYGDAFRAQCQPRLLPEKHLAYLDWLRSYLTRKHPGKTVCSKYFGGVHHFAELRRRSPRAKLVLLYRDPESVCYSLATQLESAFGARRLRIEQPARYWRNVYRYLVSTYEKLDEVAESGGDELLVVWDADVKSDLTGTVERIGRHAGLAPTRDSRLAQKLKEKSARGPYQRSYRYSSAFDGMFSRDDFRTYYQRARARKPPPEANGLSLAG